MSRTHSVALDGSFDRINLDPKIQPKYDDTKQPTRRHCSFTREAWNHLLCLFNFMNNSMFSSSHFRPISYLQTTSKKLIQEGKQGGEEERVVAQSRLARNPVARNLNRSSTVPSSSSSQSLENLTEKIVQFFDSLSTGKLVAMDSNKNNASCFRVVQTLPRGNKLRDRVRVPLVQDCSLTISL